MAATLLLGFPRYFLSCHSGTTVDSRAQERHVLRRMFSGRVDAPKPQVKIHSGWVVCSLSSLSWIVGPVLPLQNSANYATLSGPCFASSSVSVQQSAVLWDLKSLPRPTNTKDATRAAWRNRPVSHPHQTKVEWFIMEAQEKCRAQALPSPSRAHPQVPALLLNTRPALQHG